jgi:ubiquinone/menaquinone biosynthesis C-methylase UbiE
VNTEKIEILPVDLLVRHPEVVRSIRSLARSTRLEIGWHYLLDLTWIITNLGAVTGMKFLDAGAGIGLMQWCLIERGAAEVISADRTSRSNMPLILRSRYHMHGLREGDLGPAWKVVKDNVQNSHGSARARSFLIGSSELGLSVLPKRFPGLVIIYNQDLTSMPEIPDNSLDAVVAVSALEHNSPEGLQKVVAEIMRKLKPGGKLLATLCAGKGKDWFHEASQGWCYTDATLRRLFDLPADTPSNYSRHDELLEALRNCTELRENLAKFYSRSGDNGMPWGKWDPQYQPVGVYKIKPVHE